MWRRKLLVADLFRGDRCAAGCFRSCAACACDTVVALDRRPVSPGVSVRRRRRHRARAAQSAGAAGQRARVRSRRRGAMGPDPRRRRAAAGALPQATLPLAAELGHDHAVGAQGAAAASLCARLGVRDAAGERRGVRAVAVLAGFFRALDPWRDSLRSGADDDAADRHRRRSRPRSWRWALPITAIAANCWCGPRGCSSRSSWCCRSLLIAADGAAGRGDRGCRQRPAGSIRAAGGHHHQADAAAAASARRFSGRADDRRDSWADGRWESSSGRWCRGPG